MAIQVLFLVIVKRYPVLERRRIRTCSYMRTDAKVASDRTLRRGHTLLPKTRMTHIKGFSDGEPRRKVVSKRLQLICDLLNNVRFALGREIEALFDRQSLIVRIVFGDESGEM